MKKSLSVILLSLAVFASIGVCTQALGLQHVSRTSGFYNTIQAGFSESQFGTGYFGTDPSRIVKQCHVRLREGSYDSGRIYSAVGDQFGGSDYIWTNKLSKFNNPFQTCYTYYGWLYY